VCSFDDFKELSGGQKSGGMAKVNAAGKYRTEGKSYIVRDGDIIFFVSRVLLPLLRFSDHFDLAIQREQGKGKELSRSKERTSTYRFTIVGVISGYISKCCIIRLADNPVFLESG
jgi:hypothetical protein